MGGIELCDICFRSELTDNQYEEICEETLDSLAEMFDDIAEMNFTSQDFDVQFVVSKVGVEKVT